MSEPFPAGLRVAFSRKFLRDTGQYTGPDAPCSFGPFARGKVIDSQIFGQRRLICVKWDDGHASLVLDCNLVREDRIHLEPV